MLLVIQTQLFLGVTFQVFAKKCLKPHTCSHMMYLGMTSHTPKKTVYQLGRNLGASLPVQNKSCAKKDRVFNTYARSLISFWKNQLGSKIQKVSCAYHHIIGLEVLNVLLPTYFIGNQNIQTLREYRNLQGDKSQGKEADSSKFKVGKFHAI